jgi:hypothetical protein
MLESNRNAKIIRLAGARDLQEAHEWRRTLEDGGVQCQIVGEYLGSFGIAPPGHSVPEVWVLQEDLERASQILDSIRAPATRPRK